MVANKILTSEGWQQRIRDKLGVDAAYLPDNTIEQPDFITVAEENIIKVIPGYESLSDKDKVYLEAATVCECAVLLCPSMPARLPKREQGPHYTKEASSEWSSIQKDITKEKNIYLEEILPGPHVKMLHFDLTRS